jgi:hypothetical protein
MRCGNVLSTLTFGANNLLSAHTTYGSSAFYTFDTQGSTCQSLTSTGAINYTSLVTAFEQVSDSEATADIYDGFGAQFGYRNEEMYSADETRPASPTRRRAFRCALRAAYLVTAARLLCPRPRPRLKGAR